MILAHQTDYGNKKACMAMLLPRLRSTLREKLLRVISTFRHCSMLFFYIHVYLRTVREGNVSKCWTPMYMGNPVGEGGEQC